MRTGIAWTGTFRVIMQVLNTGSQVVLARLLLPTDYGLVALTGVFMAFAAMLTQLGLAAAVVQSRRVTERLLSTAFWLNVISGIVVTGVLVAAAPLVADFYGDERVTNLLRVSSLSFTLSCAAVHSALLQRSLQFQEARLAGGARGGDRPRRHHRPRVAGLRRVQPRARPAAADDADDRGVLVAGALAAAHVHAPPRARGAVALRGRS